MSQLEGAGTLENLALESNIISPGSLQTTHHNRRRVWITPLPGTAEPAPTTIRNLHLS